MSGTSMDAVDACVVRFVDDRLDLIRYQQFPFAGGLAAALNAIGPHSSLDETFRLHAILGLEFAEAALGVMKLCGIEARDVAAIGCHGQTVLHRPSANPPFTVQLGDPNRVAWRTRIMTIADFRGMDIAAGGQGAPLAPAFHAQCFARESAPRVVVNIGGIANISVLPPAGRKDVSGFDTGPGNTLMDLWARQHHGEPFDAEGRWARTGRPDPGLLRHLLEDPYFGAAPPKSTGRDLFNMDWLRDRGSSRLAALKPEDVQATLLELTGETIAAAIERNAADIDEVVICGGGARNLYLLERLSSRLARRRVFTSEELGIDPDSVEACMIAWLAKLRLNAECVDLTGITGASKPAVLGSIYMTGGEG